MKNISQGVSVVKLENESKLQLVQDTVEQATKKFKEANPVTSGEYD